MIASICRSALLVLVISAATVRGAERSALEWLDVMNRAFRTLDYDGVFSYQSGAGLTTLRLVHVVIDGIEHERIIHLDGARREFVRRGREITRILHPEDKILELEKAVPPTPFVQAFSSQLDAIGDVYEVELNGIGRVAGRRAIRLRVAPRDQDRYTPNSCSSKDLVERVPTHPDPRPSNHKGGRKGPNIFYSYKGHTHKPRCADPGSVQADPPSA